ncbi:MAG: hypothetical protein WDZ62_02540 [Candidatus Pacearchaeota archaeon]
MKKEVKIRNLLIEKRGQYYLISAIILGVLIIGIVAVSNYLERGSSENINNLEEEIKIESANVLDYSLNQGQNFESFHNTMLDFTQKYIEYYGSDMDIYFLFGSNSNMTLKGVQNVDKTITLISGENSVGVTSEKGQFLGSINPSGEEISLEIEEIKYDFNLNTERNFNFVLAERVSGNEYIISG